MPDEDGMLTDREFEEILVRDYDACNLVTRGWYEKIQALRMIRPYHDPDLLHAQAEYKFWGERCAEINARLQEFHTVRTIGDLLDRESDS